MIFICFDSIQSFGEITSLSFQMRCELDAPNLDRDKTGGVKQLFRLTSWTQNLSDCLLKFWGSRLVSFQ